MRLIDADKLKINLYHNKKVVLNDDLVKCIDDTETAYDIDKVIEELELIRAKKTCNKEKCDTKEICRICVVDDAIKIIKHGNVVDNMCNTKQGKWIFDKFTAQYGNPYRCSCCSEEFEDTYNYCPNCGVNMKEVE